ncbi:MAG: hypothetical protein ACOYYS_03025 [Chloroflexota bacterium]
MIQNLFYFLFAWYNLLFTALIGTGLFLAALQLIGLGGDGDSQADAGGDADADLSVDHDIDYDLSHGLDHDLDHDLGHDVDHDLDHALDHGADHDAGGHDVGHSDSGFSLLAFIGVGKVPLLVVLLILFGAIGLLGWLLNSLVLSIFTGFPGLMIVITGPVAFLAGGIFTSRLTRLIGQILPPISTTVSRAQALVGQHGTVISPYVDGRYGMIHLRDQGGTLISLFAVTEDEQPIPRGEQVILVSYDAAQRRYLVTRR